jgi:hypothetical protein
MNVFSVRDRNQLIWAVIKRILSLAMVLAWAGSGLCFAADPVTRPPLLFKPTDRSVTDKTRLTGERYIQFLKLSIENATQWVASRKNNEHLWAEARLMTENFLLTEWRSGRLQGVTAAQAYFVRCDRSTMTQADIDNGLLVVIVGVAPLKPAEFEIFTIRRKTLTR